MFARRSTPTRLRERSSTSAIQTSTYSRIMSAWPEATSVAPNAMLPLHAVLLLRLGQVYLARSFWNAWVSGLRPDTNNDNEIRRDPYLTLATDWVWARFDRAVCAHMGGDDALALSDTMALGSVRDAVESEAHRRNFTLFGDASRARYLPFLDPLEALRADSERRVAAGSPPPRVPVEHPGYGMIPLPGNPSVADVIADLEFVDARQDGQPGGVDLGMDPRVISLIRAGDAAVDPLIGVLENDTRLSRSVHFGRDFAHGRTLIGVHEAAYVALVGILKTSFFSAGSTADDLTSRGFEGRRAVAAARVRAFWERWRHVPMVERWFALLADDAQPPDQWIQAAANIVQPTNVEVVPGSMVFVTDSDSRASVGAACEPAWRVASFARSSEFERAARTPHRVVEGGCEQHRIADGGLRTCGSTLRLGAGRTRRRPERACTSGLHAPAGYFGRSAAGRVCSRDDPRETSIWRCPRPRTVRDMARRPAARDALRRRAQKHSNRSGEDPDAPAVRDAIEAMFGHEGRGWLSAAGNGYYIDPLLRSPLLRAAAYRRYALRRLSDTQIVGTLRIDARTNYTMHFADGGSSSRGVDEAAARELPQIGSTMDVRRCDQQATEIVARRGTLPAFQPWWSVSRRDHALSDVRRWVEREGARRDALSEDELDGN